MFACLAGTLVFATSAAAQKQQGAEMRNPPLSSIMWGPFAGLNYTSVYGSDVSDASSRADFAVGGQVDFSLTPDVLFRSGLVYSRRGAKNSDQGVTETIKIDYVEVPVLLGYRFANTGGARPYVIGGGQLGFKVGCDLEESSGGVSGSIACDDPQVGGDFASTDISVLGGAGVAIPMGINSFTIDLRYALGLQKIEKNTQAKNRGFTLGFGFMMPLGK
jgi:hypothetical protein